MYDNLCKSHNFSTELSSTGKDLYFTLDKIFKITSAYTCALFSIIPLIFEFRWKINYFLFSESGVSFSYEVKHPRKAKIDHFRKLWAKFFAHFGSSKMSAPRLTSRLRAERKAAIYIIAVLSNTSSEYVRVWAQFSTQKLPTFICLFVGWEFRESLFKKFVKFACAIFVDVNKKIIISLNCNIVDLITLKITLHCG